MTYDEALEILIQKHCKKCSETRDFYISCDGYTNCFEKDAKELIEKDNYLDHVLNYFC